MKKLSRRKLLATGLGASLVTSGCGPSGCITQNQPPVPPPPPVDNDSLSGTGALDLPILPTGPNQFITDFYPQPYDLLGARLASIVFREGRAGALQSIVDASLNAIAGHQRFQMLMPGWGLACVFDFSEVRSTPATPNQPTPSSTTPPPQPETAAANRFGYMAYNEATVVLVLKDTANGNALCIYNPVMMLSNFAALIAGREIYGFPKVLGKFVTSGLSVDVSPLGSELLPISTTVSVQGYSTTSATERMDWQPVMKGSFSNYHPWVNNPGNTSPNQLIEDIAAMPEDMVDAWALVKPLVTAFMHDSINGLFIKQFPTAHDVSRTCYRRVISAPYRVKKLHRLRFARGRATFYSPASYRLAEMLGMSHGQDAGFFAFIAEMDWLLGAGTEI